MSEQEVIFLLDRLNIVRNYYVSSSNIPLPTILYSLLCQILLSTSLLIKVMKLNQILVNLSLESAAIKMYSSDREPLTSPSNP